MKKENEIKMNELNKKEIIFCSSCLKAKCNGECEDFKRYHNKLLKEAKVGRITRVNRYGY